ncbi:SusC/RagA family TonB-linked outer membrane protein [Rufibacter immobilis]|uniref:SusC/RagA family TonB-linked outer membrane protein n=2 Tax=Rufibacter immobilis TaxID=1348778 RepID=A0A3M9N7W1_9BACT|nr:SusC/RagA family TonB-linked outer membrane protein [Rufibacter immobilis]
MLTLLTQAWAQSRTVSGRVTDATTGEGMPGVTVQLKGTSTASPTGIDGSYSINVPSSGGALVFSFIGYTNQEIAIGTQTSINVRLATDSKALSEVVVVGAGGIERQVKEQGYNTTIVKSEELTQGRAQNVAVGLTGKVAGLQINAVSSGVNPNVRIVLRGNRSLTGNNQALIVLDNVIVPNEVLGNLNPEDIETVQVLNGANAAALYGSSASNGAILLFTKKGKKGQSSIRVAHTTTLEQVSFHPALQNEFGSGFATGFLTYVPYENQQYGPRFDGSMVQIGKPLEDGSIQTVPYTARDDKYDFWETGVQNQTDVSLSSGSENGRTTFYVSAQRLKNKGTTYKDQYNRESVRVNGTHDLGNKVSLAFNTNYTSNLYDITSQTSAIYDALLQTPAHIPLLQYKDWQNNKFANPNGYYNEYYDNPYFLIDNNRQNSRNIYLVASTEIKYAPLDWLDFTYRVGISNRNVTTKSTTGVFTLTDYTKSISASKYDVTGGVTDGNTTTNQLNGDFLAQFNKNVTPDFNVRFILGHSIRTNYSKSLSVGTSGGLVIPDLYNVSNSRLNTRAASEANYTARQIGLFGDLTLGYKDYLFLHLTGRNDWVSILAPENRSFFYPAADISFMASEAIPFLSESEWIDELKVRGGISKVGQVNLGGTFGAYQLNPTFGVAPGFPYGSLAAYTINNSIVSSNLKPEMTTAYEAGFDVTLKDGLITASGTYYASSTVDQTVSTGISSTTGYTSFLTNTGEVTNKGVEARVAVTPIRGADWTVTVGTNYTFNDSKVVSISSDQERLQLSTGGAAQVYAIVGNRFPALLGNDYIRDDQGRVVVDRITGYPSINNTQVYLGHTEPLHRMGVDAEVRYKNFRLTTLFEYRGNFYRYHNSSSSLDFSGSSAATAVYNRDRFIFPNSSFFDEETGQYVANTSITVRDGGSDFWASNNFNRNVATNYTTKGDYWKLREASISYEVPRALLARTGFVKGATIALQGRNLFLWTPRSNKFTDPDYNLSDTNAIGITTLGQTPPTRYYGATVAVTF